jgi:hypothetical protein
MKLTENLSDFNRRMADELRSTFASSVKPYETEDRILVFRGPIAGNSDPDHVGTHVSISLDEPVVAALGGAESSRREEMIQNLISSLSTQVKVRYDPNNVGPDALSVTGTMQIVNG